MAEGEDFAELSGGCVVADGLELAAGPDKKKAQWSTCAKLM